ncbi:MAG: YabP/YqfC family sporulation protein [Clostridia bacterium]|nr:YabP/YqfC family sporulation protein [Clostridia bacterium]
MGFIEEIKNCFCVEELPVNPCYRAVIFGDSAVYLENVKAIVYYTTEEIALTVKGGGIILRGENLYVKKYCAGDLAVCGKIKALERV